MLGDYLQVLVGAGVPLPAPVDVITAITAVEVQTRAEGRTGFQVTLAAGRSSLAGAVDFDVLMGPTTAPFNRIVLTAILGGMPTVLVDGIVTNRQVSASSEPGGSRVTLTGEDLTVKMDLEERVVEHPAQTEMVIALKLLARYAPLGIVPTVVPPPSLDVPNPLERIPVQRGTDLAYLRTMADRFGYVFHLTPGPVPLVSQAYWGPPVRVGVPQPAITVGSHAHANCARVDVQYDGLGPATVTGTVQDRQLGTTLPVFAKAPLRAPLSAAPAWATQGGDVRTEVMETSGLTWGQAFSRAQGRVDAAADALTVSGELDGASYGRILRAGGLVGLRGVGLQHDGLWYVQSVRHTFGPGRFRSGFTLTREGVVTTTPVVVP